MSADSTTERLVHLESVVAHLQHDLERMNAALLDQQAELRRLHETIARLQAQLLILNEGDGDLPHEKPPHY